MTTAGRRPGAVQVPRARVRDGTAAPPEPVALDAGMRTGRRRWTIGMAAVMAVVVGLLGLAARDAKRGERLPLRPAPAFDLERLDQPGARLQLADHRGRPLLINFWASWCPACREEMPELQAVAQKFGGRLDVIGVNMWDSRADAVALLTELGVTYPTGIDPDGGVVRDYGVSQVPSTMFVTADGRLAARANGKPSPVELQEMLSTYLALTQPAPGPAS
ncbi:MAG: TlpA family protein disulfide reductase [Actinobacteria bacterium]|nr:TlpA family protein disulfide reductase [Actinomycetota bacterium]